jgi:enoyl-CoA hydratase
MNYSPPLATGTVRLERDGPIGWIILDHPEKHNALNTAMWRGLPHAIVEAEADPDIRVIIVRGTGEKAFCAGADISEFDAARHGSGAREYDTFNHTAFDMMSRAGKPVIAMIHGFCLGGGLGLVVSCDLRIASDQALFGLPPARLGLGYNPRWIKPLVAILGAANAKELFFTAARIDAATAQRMGLVNRIIPKAELVSETRKLALTIAANAPLTMLAAKRAIDAYAGDLPEATLRELDALVEHCFGSSDYEEGRRAFAEKREPVFKGC